jgi:hypothetical protein
VSPGRYRATNPVLRLWIPVRRRRAVAIVVAGHDRHDLVIAKLMIPFGPDKASWRSRIDLSHTDTVWGLAGLVRFPRVELRLAGLGVSITAIGGCHARNEAGDLKVV